MGCAPVARTTIISTAQSFEIPGRVSVQGQRFPFKIPGGPTKNRGRTPAVICRKIGPFRSRRLPGSTISHPYHKAGTVIRAGREIGFEIDQLFPFPLKLGLERKGLANTRPIGG